MKRLITVIIAAALLAPSPAWAAIGCTLSNPAQDLKYLFPQMSSYKEELLEFPRLKDGAELYKAFEQRVGGALDPIYETYETPYTVYFVYKGKERVGVVHGVNVPGKGGVIQVFLSTDPKSADIRKFFFQRLESPAAKALRAKEFRAQFEGMTLADFYKHDYYAAADPGAKGDRLAAITTPALGAESKQDHQAALRGIRKNLILLDFFVYGRRFEPFYERAQKAKGERK